jgi:hypothetical protein
MAITAGSLRGRAPYQVNGAEAVAPVALGASASIITPTASATVTLPTDSAGNTYAAYRITASGQIWFGFGSGPATPGGANEWLVGPGVSMDIWPPAGATQISAIFDAVSTTGSLCITGLY